MLLFARRNLILFVIAITPAAPAHAEVVGATVVVRAHCESTVLRRAKVTVRYRTGPELSTETDDAGRAWLINVPAGPVEVTVEAPSSVLCGRTSRTLELRAGETVFLHEVLSASALVVPEDAHHLRTDSRSDFASRAALHALPGSRTIWSLLETAEPAAIVDRIDGAGLFLGEPGRFSMHGSSWTQKRITIDGADVTDPLRGGTPLGMFDVDTLEAIEITSVSMPIESAGPGVVVSLVPREPSQAWSGTAQAHGLSSTLQAKDASGIPPAVARFGSMQDGGLSISGPLKQDRLRVLVSGHAARLQRFDRGDPAELNAQLVSLFGNAWYQPSVRDRIRLLGSFQSVEKPFAGRARFDGDPVTERDHFAGLQLRWEHAADRMMWSVAGSYQTGAFLPETGGRKPGRPVERVLDGPTLELVFPGHSRRNVWTIGADLALREHHLARSWHAPRFGVTLAATSATETPDTRGLTPELVAGLPARVWDYGYPGPESHRQTLDVAAYAADRIVVGDRLFVDAGLRFDVTSGWTAGASQGVTWRTLSPRVSARLRLTGRGGLAVVGGYGEYRHRLLLQHLAFGDPAGPQGSVYRWNDANGNRRFDEGERGALIARVGPGAADGALSTIDPQLKPPRTREWVAGIESRLGDSIVVRLTGFDRRERDLLASVNLGAPLSSYTVTYLPDPAGDLIGTQDDQLLPVYDRNPESFGPDRYLLTNPPDDTSHHQGLELRIEKSIASRLRFLLGGTAYRTDAAGANRGFRVNENDQGVIGELFEEPNAGTHANGRTFFDRAFTLKIAASCRAPWDSSIGLVARYQDGQPFARLVVISGLHQGPELIEATPRGQIARGWAVDAEGRSIVPSGHRFTYTLTLDGRLEKGVPLLGHRLSLIAEVFNVLDTRNEVEEWAVGGPSFREATAVQPPRVWRFGLRYDF